MQIGLSCHKYITTFFVFFIQTGDLASAQLGGAPNRWEVLSATPTTIKDEAGNLVQIPGAATSSGQYVLPLQNLQNQQIFSVAPGSIIDSTVS